AGAIAEGNDRREVEKALENLRDRAREFFTELAAGIRGSGSVLAGSKNETRVRVTADVLVPVGEAAAYLAGALDLVESTLALIQEKKSGDDDSVAPPDDLGALARRAREIRDELRFLMRAGDEGFVYFIERRGKGLFLRASPIDVSTIVRELLLDR